MFEDLAKCMLCPERQFARVPVPGIGDIKTKIVLLGRNPGVNEDKQGVPFIGRAGGRLNEGCVLAGLLRRSCWVTNVSKCMTPTQRTPSKECRTTCVKQWLIPELREIDPEVILTLGNEALQVFEIFGRVGELHGTIFMTDKIWGPGRVQLFVSYHPSAALRSKSIYDLYRKDMIEFGKWLTSNGYTGGDER